MMGDAGNAMLSEGAGEDAEEVFDNGVGDMGSYGTKTLDYRMRSQITLQTHMSID